MKQLGKSGILASYWIISMKLRLALYKLLGKPDLKLINELKREEFLFWKEVFTLISIIYLFLLPFTVPEASLRDWNSDLHYYCLEHKCHINFDREGLLFMIFISFL